MKRPIGILLLAAALLLSGCRGNDEASEYNRYSEHYFDMFDTIIQVIGYEENDEKFDEYNEKIEQEFREYHQLYDRYNDYEGINNVHTINQYAGKEPVEVDKRIIDLIRFAKEWHDKTGGKLNIAAGEVIDSWNETMETSRQEEADAELPDKSELASLRESVNLDYIEIDKEEQTVFLTEENMSLDFGAVAKGFASEEIGEMMKQEGFTSGAIAAGGNWNVLGEPKEEDRTHWNIAVQAPEGVEANDGDQLGRIRLENKSVDTSGDSQRYEMVDDVRVHHLIDLDTLMPAERHRSVTVVHKRAAVSEYLSTELFLLSQEEGEKLLDDINGAEALWVTEGGAIEKTAGMEKDFDRE
ncbi:FAD:protein FMN transferase [Salisediminibacterium halotolerans]|uniref:FAD:protein FMN transferase n=1 Tax=Salisediminibacterium halotolerans TaxID=517425 RepID=A0A1H9TA62_9BACI|nr:FAD:protein FMN transferase [Salisediminibacterium haloalkalitolerans]SER94016.1 thiamine biosynthesis lipoprotein [Salisediminibacterium haloalkalitolerans]